MRNAGERRLQNFVTLFCALVFALFGFTFVAVYKSAEIEVFYDALATGKLQYNGYVLSAVFTSLLLGLALWLNRFAGFRREWSAMAYVPSALLLAFFTGIDRTFFTGGKEYAVWAWAFGAGLLLYAGFSFVLNRMLFEKIKDSSAVAHRIIWRNLILFVIMFMAVGCLSGSERNFRREALQYTLFKKGDMEAALAVGRHSPVASRQLSAQRAYMLSLKGELADHFFDYPVCFDSESLLPSVERDAPIEPCAVYSHIGIERKPGEGAMDFLSRAVEQCDTNVVAREYYLTALLTERRLVDFVDKVFEYYNVGDSDRLPKHYKEALVLYAFILPSFDVRVKDEAMVRRFTAMMEAVRECGDAPMTAYLMRIVYGDTYWWYFLYGE